MVLPDRARRAADVSLAEFMAWPIEERKAYLDWLVGQPAAVRSPVERRWRAEWSEFERTEAPFIEA